MTRRYSFYPHEWYWYVGGDTSQVYSSKLNAYVSPSDQGFADWKARFERDASNVLDENDLGYYMTPIWGAAFPPAGKKAAKKK
jgi:hypothetical protein